MNATELRRMQAQALVVALHLYNSLGLHGAYDRIQTMCDVDKVFWMYVRLHIDSFVTKL